MKSDMPFRIGMTVIERVGAGEHAQVNRTRIVKELNSLCMTSTNRWYRCDTGRREPGNHPSQYRAIHSVGYAM